VTTLTIEWELNRRGQIELHLGDELRAYRLGSQHGVPVHGMHTKWLARHRGMVLAILGTPTTSSDPNEPSESSGDADPADTPPTTSTPSGCGPYRAKSASSLPIPSCAPQLAGCDRSAPLQTHLKPDCAKCNTVGIRQQEE
jgi:hypothetical protein